MDDLISRQAVIEINRSYHGQMPNEVNHRIWKEINELPSAQPETHDKRTETHACDCISRQAAIDAHYEYCNKHPDAGFPVWSLKILEDLSPAQPEVLACGEGELSAQPEIIRCNDCKHWTQTTGNMRGFGLGDCDYINAKLVNCNGFCYWAERRTDG